ncbi:hypothetical protein QBC35DRAFT_46378 [Podospora australis]|uniref:Uncharacterized protein n=1 Tax=Podospora australis TaxID=1536484 RepID=A0AAN7AFG7_9PEZI|nr:hypothetical protein QBC35DRAFT_46378 [Podospora australis]
MPKRKAAAPLPKPLAEPPARTTRCDIERRKVVFVAALSQILHVRRCFPAHCFRRIPQSQLVRPLDEILSARREAHSESPTRDTETVLFLCPINDYNLIQYLGILINDIVPLIESNYLLMFRIHFRNSIQWAEDCLMEYYTFVFKTNPDDTMDMEVWRGGTSAHRVGEGNRGLRGLGAYLSELAPWREPAHWSIDFVSNGHPNGAHIGQWDLDHVNFNNAKPTLESRKAYALSRILQLHLDALPLKAVPPAPMQDDQINASWTTDSHPSSKISKRHQVSDRDDERISDPGFDEDSPPIDPHSTQSPAPPPERQQSFSDDYVADSGGLDYFSDNEVFEPVTTQSQPIAEPLGAFPRKTSLPSSDEFVPDSFDLGHNQRSETIKKASTQIEKATKSQTATRPKRKRRSSDDFVPDPDAFESDHEREDGAIENDPPKNLPAPSASSTSRLKIQPKVPKATTNRNSPHPSPSTEVPKATKAPRASRQPAKKQKLTQGMQVKTDAPATRSPAVTKAPAKPTAKRQSTSARKKQEPLSKAKSNAYSSKPRANMNGRGNRVATAAKVSNGGAQKGGDAANTQPGGKKFVPKRKPKRPSVLLDDPTIWESESPSVANPSNPSQSQSRQRITKQRPLMTQQGKQSNVSLKRAASPGALDFFDKVDVASHALEEPRDSSPFDLPQLPKSSTSTQKQSGRVTRSQPKAPEPDLAPRTGGSSYELPSLHDSDGGSANRSRQSKAVTSGSRPNIHP